MSLGMIRNLLWESVDSTYEEQLNNERWAQREAGRSKDFMEGVRAFNEKRELIFGQVRLTDNTRGQQPDKAHRKQNDEMRHGLLVFNAQLGKYELVNRCGLALPPVAFIT